MDVLKLGSHGQDVILLQTILKKEGLYTDLADGDFGPRTKTSLAAYQTKHGLLPDGIMGPLTARALDIVPAADSRLGNDATAPRTGNTPITVPLPPVHCKGVDISKWQPDFSDPMALARGFDFCYLKATQGQSIVDPAYHAHYDILRAAGLATGLLVGSYHWYTPGLDPKAQLAHFLKNSNLRSGDLAPMIDFEEKYSGNAKTLVEELDVFGQGLIQKCGKVPFLYCGAFYIIDLINRGADSSLLYKYTPWVAAYSVAPKLPPPWWPAQLKMWQWAGSGVASGIRAKDVDKDYFYGTKEELAKYCI